MKIIGFFLLISFGLASQGFSQDNKFQAEPNLMPKLFERNQFSRADTLKLEPLIIFPNQPLFFSERKLSFEISSPIQMPVYELPDPHSRMPIKVFDDSVNYTILKKEYR